jgi:hypothetical protein
VDLKFAYAASLKVNCVSMCGAVGFTASKNLVSSDFITKMAPAVAHRGPDDAGYDFQEIRKELDSRFGAGLIRQAYPWNVLMFQAWLEAQEPMMSRIIEQRAAQAA